MYIWCIEQGNSGVSSGVVYIESGPGADEKGRVSNDVTHPSRLHSLMQSNTQHQTVIFD